MQNKKRIILLSIIGLLIISILAIGVSKAYLEPIETTKEPTKVTLKSCAKIAFSDNESVNLNNMAPMDDELVISKVKPYNFNITSTCEEGTSFSLYLGITNNNSLDKNNLKYGIKLKGSKSFIISGKLSDLKDIKNTFSEDELSQIASQNNSVILKLMDASVAYNHEKNYELYIWINSEVDDPNTMNKTFNANVFVKATGEYEEEKEHYVTLIPLNEYILSLVGTSGEGELLYHDLDNKLAGGYGAADGSYRYSGNEPNNYVCLGTKTDSGGCDDNKNLYRIIGVIPVKVEGGTTQNLVKLIKSEYITKDELGGSGIQTGSPLIPTVSYPKRIRSDSVDSFYWSGSSSNSSSEWQKSTIYSTLNNTTTGYLSKMGEWKDKIEKVTWNIAGISQEESRRPAKEVFKVEMSNNTTGTNKVATKTVDAQVGLMYVADYGFASSKDNWQTNLNEYNSDANRNANWLFNAVYEWSISRNTDLSGLSEMIRSEGNIGRQYVKDYTYGIRPSFYLKSTVNYLEGEGSYAKPIFLG